LNRKFALTGGARSINTKVEAENWSVGADDRPPIALQLRFRAAVGSRECAVTGRLRRVLAKKPTAARGRPLSNPMMRVGYANSILSCILIARGGVLAAIRVENFTTLMLEVTPER
jgi:hypothetical protein